MKNIIPSWATSKLAIVLILHTLIFIVATNGNGNKGHRSHKPRIQHDAPSHNPHVDKSPIPDPELESITAEAMEKAKSVDKEDGALFYSKCYKEWITEGPDLTLTNFHEVLYGFLKCFFGLEVHGSRPRSRADVDADSTKWTHLQCRDGVYGPNDEREEEIAKCIETHGPEPGMKNPNCIYHCIAGSLGVVNKEGLPTGHIYDKWIEATFPKRHQRFAKSYFHVCLKRFGNYIDLSDPECTMASKFNHCCPSIQKHMTC